MPKQLIWINALHPRHPDGYFRFQARVPNVDIREYAENGELYAIESDNWNWVGCMYSGEWFRFISRQAYEHELKVFAEIDARVERGDLFPRDLIESKEDPRNNLQALRCAKCGKYFLLVAPDKIGEKFYKACSYCGTSNELEPVKRTTDGKLIYRVKGVLEQAR